MRIRERLLFIAASLVACAVLAGCDSGGPVRPTPECVTLVRQIDGYGSSIITFSPSGEVLGLVTSEGWAVLDAIQGDALFAGQFQNETCGCISDHGCAFSRGEQLFAASLNNALVVVDLVSGDVVISDEYPYGHPLWSMGALAFTPDGQNLLIGGQIAQVYVLDLLTGQLADSLNPGGSVTGIETLPDGHTAAIARVMGEVLLWDWEQHAVVGTLSDCESYCTSLGLAGSYLMAGCGGHAIRVWDSGTYEYLGLIEGHEFIGQQFGASGSRSLLVAGSGPGSPNNPEGLTTSEIVIIDLRTFGTLHSWRAHTAAGIYDTAFSPNGDILATCGYDGVIKVWALCDLGI